MKKIWLLTTILICWLLLTGCNNSLNEDIIPNDKAETNIVLNFELLTGSWKDIDQMDKEREKWYDNAEVQELSTNYFKSKSITFNQISKALEDTSYHIEYDKKYWDEELLIVEATWWYPNWKLYDWDKLIWEWNNIWYFEKQWKHFILCYNWKDWHSCIIDWEVNTLPYIIDMQWALPKIYNWDVYKIKWLWYWKGWDLDKFWVYKNNEELYTFEAEHPTDTTVQSLVVDDSWWWVFYRTRNVWEEGIFFHLIHNWEDLWEINWWEDIIWLNNYRSKAFYMYKKDWVIYYNLNWEDYKTEYEDIIHDLCCSPWMYNITFRNSAFTFYWKKDWEYSLIKWDFTQKKNTSNQKSTWEEIAYTDKYDITLTKKWRTDWDKEDWPFYSWNSTFLTKELDNWYEYYYDIPRWSWKNKHIIIAFNSDEYIWESDLDLSNTEYILNTFEERNPYDPYFLIPKIWFTWTVDYMQLWEDFEIECRDIDYLLDLDKRNCNLWKEMDKSESPFSLKDWTSIERLDDSDWCDKFKWYENRYIIKNTDIWCWVWVNSWTKVKSIYYK